jgi:succinate dehydrogenase/fumarate reductase-like Fe-S protein
MEEKIIKLLVSRYDPAQDTSSRMQSFEVPVSEGMDVLGAMDYIYENLDESLAYYDHGACAQGICKTCLAKVNGKPQLMCQTLLQDLGGEVRVEPLDRFEVLRDVVTWKGGEK